MKEREMCMSYYEHLTATCRMRFQGMDEGRLEDDGIQVTLNGIFLKSCFVRSQKYLVLWVKVLTRHTTFSFVAAKTQIAYTKKIRTD
jgi:hypothetical protein